LRRLGIQLLNKEDLTLDQASTREEQWAYYVDSYYMHADTEGVATEMLAAPWLRRSVASVDSLQESTLLINELQVKICLNTYKLFYLVNTEDTLVRSKGNRILAEKKLGYNRAVRMADGNKWTRNGYITKEEQNAAAAAAEAKEQTVVPHPSTFGASGTQSPPAASSVTPAPQTDLQQSVDPTPQPPPSVSKEPSAPPADVKIESPTARAEGGEAMDVEPSDSALAYPETREEEPQGASEDVEMPDA
jgi:C-terminal domain of Sin3a protein